MKEYGKTVEKTPEIKEGRKIRILEHEGCRGSTGTVIIKNKFGYLIKCDTCQKTVMPDLRI